MGVRTDTRVEAATSSMCVIDWYLRLSYTATLNLYGVFSSLFAATIGLIADCPWRDSLKTMWDVDDPLVVDRDRVLRNPQPKTLVSTSGTNNHRCPCSN